MSLNNIVIKSGLDPTKFVNDWKTNELAISTWLQSGHLEEVTIEVYRPGSSSSIGRWDLSIEHGTDADGFWFDPDDIYYHIRKCGHYPADCEYAILLSTKPGRPDVLGWSSCKFRSTEGMVRQSIGTMIDANGLKASASYWTRQ
jgi:hypothetical protein